MRMYQNKNNNIIERIAITAFFMYAVIFQGFYFWGHYLAANLLLIIYAGYMIRKKKGEKILLERASDNNIQDAKFIIYPLIVFVVLYILSIFNSTDKASAILETIKVIGFPFALSIGLYADNKQRLCIDRAIIISGIVSALIGITVVGGIVIIEGAVFNNRIQSTFQYANTAALYFSICIILLLKYLDEEKNKMLVNISIYILMCSFILTYSRGMWLLFGVFSMFALFSHKLIPDKNDRVRYFFILLVAVAISIALTSGASLLWFLFMFFTGMVICIIPEYTDKKYYSGGTIFLMVCVVLSSFLYRGEIYQRITNISMYATEWVSRVSYYKGGITLFHDYPLFGAGAGSWASLSERYVGEYVKYIHSYYLQLMCELGIIGILTFALIIVGVIRSFIVNTYRDWHSCSVFIIILLHAFIDISMNFQLIAIVLFIYSGYIIRRNKILKSV
jgi:hypothetical protein